MRKLLVSAMFSVAFSASAIAQPAPPPPVRATNTLGNEPVPEDGGLRLGVKPAQNYGATTPGYGAAVAGYRASTNGYASGVAGYGANTKGLGPNSFIAPVKCSVEDEGAGKCVR